MSGSVEHLGRRAGFDDPAEVHHGDAVGDVAHHRKIVRDEQVGQAELLLQRLQQIDDLRLDRHVERGDRLVENEQIGTQRQSTGNGDALALAAGEFTRPPLAGFRVEADLPQQLGNAPGVMHAIDPQRLGDDLGDRHPRIERRIRVLKHDLQLTSHGAKPTDRQSLNIPPEDDRAGGRRVQAKNHAAEGSTCASRLANKTGRSPSFLQRDVVDGDRRNIPHAARMENSPHAIEVSVGAPDFSTAGATTTAGTCGGGRLCASRQSGRPQVLRRDQRQLRHAGLAGLRRRSIRAQIETPSPTAVARVTGQRNRIERPRRL
jgi:hypothetical protein